MRKKNEDPLHARAVNQVNKKKGFFIHFGIYLLCSIFLFLINFLTTFPSGHSWWFFYPVLGWGLGVGIHYLTVFGLPGTDILSKEWEEREVLQEMERLRRQSEITKGLTSSNEHLDLENPPNMEKEVLGRRWDEDELV